MTLVLVTEGQRENNYPNHEIAIASCCIRKNMNYGKASLRSGLMEHCLKKEHHQPLFDSTRILSRVEGVWQRVILEAIYIQKVVATLSRDMGLKLDKVWCMSDS